MPTSIEWATDTINPFKVRVRKDAAAIAQDKGYTSLVKIAERTAGKSGWHCEIVDHRCIYCYADTMNSRCLPGCGTGLPYDRRSRDLIEVIMDEDALMQPLKWRKPRTIFPCSMTDAFGEWVSARFIAKLFAVMSQTPEHRYIVLTKRHEGMLATLANPGFLDLVEACIQDFGWCHANTAGRWPLPNVILGISASDQSTLDAAAPYLLRTPAAHRCLSLEPLLGPVKVPFPKCSCAAEIRGSTTFGSKFHGLLCDKRRCIDWVIVGGESGPSARPCNIAWIRDIIRQCREVGVPCFVKQLGADSREMDAGGCRDVTCTHFDCGASRLRLSNRKGSDPSEWPADLCVRELPEVLRG